jgi:diguanylate cyclase (GGDEF)-like protein
MVITITMPVSVGRRSCRLELIQRILEDGDKGPLVSAEQDHLIRHLRKLTITDELTSVYNRRYIYEQLPIDFACSFQKTEPLSIIYTDIDCFKDINDNYGHVTGDLVLKEIAGIFQQQVQKEGGWAARYAGDEFLICLPSIHHTAAAQIADRICKMVEATDFNINKNTLKITSSFGVETIYPGNGVNSVDEIVELADRKLYQAKRKGGNQVVA